MSATRAMQQNIVGSNEWRGARGFRRRENEGRRHSTAQYKELKKTIDRCRTARAQGKPIEITECVGRKREDDAACLLLCCREKHRWGRKGGRVRRGELRESERKKNGEIDRLIA